MDARRTNLHWSALSMLVLGLTTSCTAVVGGADDPDPRTRTHHAALTMSEIASYAKDAGVSCDQLATSVAIAMAESKGNPHAKGKNKPTKGCSAGSYDRGLWQINDCYHKEIDDACAYDPACNAGAMFTISSGGTKWTPWSTFKNGDYEAYLDEAKAEADKVCSGETDDAGTDDDAAEDSGTPEKDDDSGTFDDTGADDAGDDDAAVEDSGADPWDDDADVDDSGDPTGDESADVPDDDGEMDYDWDGDDY